MCGKQMNSRLCTEVSELQAQLVVEEATGLDFDDFLCLDQLLYGRPLQNEEGVIVPEDALVYCDADIDVFLASNF